MKLISRIVLHTTMGLFFCSVLYTLSVANLSRAVVWDWLHMAAILVGFSGLCIPRKKTLLIGAVASVFYAVSFSIQVARHLIRFSGWTVSSYFGPWEFHGTVGQLVLWGPPAVIIISGIMFISCMVRRPDEGEEAIGDAD